MSDTETLHRPTRAKAEPAISHGRPPAPEGMTYNRKGELVKRRVQSARNNKVFLVMQIISNDGEVIENLTKKNVRIVATERNSDKVLEMIDDGRHEGAFYVKVDLASH